MKLSFRLAYLEYNSRRGELKRLVMQAAKAAFAHENAAVAEVSIVLADDAAVQALNRNFRGKDKPTNVLAFGSGFGDQGSEVGKKDASEPRPLTPDPYLGDIIISLDTVSREAADQGKSFEHHLSHLVVHACLHLLGHDHLKKAEAAAMEAKEIAILKQLSIANPYD